VQARITQAAYAVLSELKRGDNRWDYERHENGDVTVDIEPDNMQRLEQVQKEEGLATISQVIVFLYKQLSNENRS
jgi:uncharacterized Ntn-hydrolase superfamily protein